MLQRNLWMYSRLGLLVALTVPLGGCVGFPLLAGPNSPGLPLPPTPAPPPTATAPPRPSPTLTPVGRPNLKVEEVAAGLDVPWSLAFAPDGRLFFTERPGRVRVMVNGQLQADPMVTVPNVQASGEGGLLGIALDPLFNENHGLYVYHTFSDNGQSFNQIVRYRETNNHAVEPQVIFTGLLGAGIHDGGRIKFGPDGKLYATVGDAGNSNQAQDPTALAGKILRLHNTGDIPVDNPFHSAIWSYGHRNPQGLAWQPGTNLLFETEHGPTGWDEVNLIEPEQNYGWPVVTAEQTGQAGFVDPILTSGPAPAWAPSGAAFGTSDWLLDWRGHLFFATLAGQHLHRLAPDTADPHHVAADEKLFEGIYGRLRDVVQGPDGLYFTTSNRDGRGTPAPTDDRILRLVPANP